MVRRILIFPLILGFLVIIAVGCAQQPDEILPNETAVPSPTKSITSPPPQVNQTAPSPASDEEPAADPGTDFPLLRFVIVAEQSEARYRVQEQLAGFTLPNDAVGVTQAISGMMVISVDGVIDPDNSRFEVDLSTLTSDQSRRDNFLRSNTLRTNQYPWTVFVPELISGLPDELPQSGQVSFILTGVMTIMDVTKPVDWEVIGNLDGDTFSGEATTSFTFDYFELVQPRVASVLSIEDNIQLEVDFTFQRVDG